MWFHVCSWIVPYLSYCLIYIHVQFYEIHVYQQVCICTFLSIVCNNVDSLSSSLSRRLDFYNLMKVPR